MIVRLYGRNIYAKFQVFWKKTPSLLGHSIALRLPVFSKVKSISANFRSSVLSLSLAPSFGGMYAYLVSNCSQNDTVSDYGELFIKVVPFARRPLFLSALQSLSVRTKLTSTDPTPLFGSVARNFHGHDVSRF